MGDDDDHTRFDRPGPPRRPPTLADSTTTATASWYTTAVDRACDPHRQLAAATYTPGNGAAAVATGSAVPAPVRGAAAAQSSAVRRKRGRPPKAGGAGGTKTAAAGDSVAVPAAAKRSKKEKEEEDVCFICFDGGKLVLCDRRDCPKAYHPACVRRDESFFRRRVRWNCGWHLCNICQRNALFLCYTCPYSLCKTCVKQADILCVRGNKGFCRTCMTTVSLIEGINEGSKCHVDFDDTTSWEYLFKVYWIFLKQKESLTSVELKCATNPWKGQILNHKNVYLQGLHSISANETVDSSSSTIQLTSHSSRVEVNGSKRRKTRKHSPLQICAKEEVKDKLHCGDVDWASKELLEFVSHMKNGDLSTLSQFDVQALLLEYIKRNSLCDPHRKSHIICDRRLETLFGKARVGHFEMLKLLEHHFKESSLQNRVVHAAAGDSSIPGLESEWRNEDTYAANRQKKRQWCEKDDLRGRQINLDNYAAIDVHNINLIYLKRSLMETLIDDADKFHDRVVGSVVRVKICGDDYKQDMYRLVRVVGTSKPAEPYKIGDKTAHIMLKILNLDKIEDVTIDGISNHDFSEDECRNLRQNMKCGLVQRITVGEVQEKAIALQAIRVNDLLEADILKLNHLRDRASEMGHRKKLRECIEKLELLKSAEEQQRRVHEIPEVHADPKMDPSYHSDEDLDQSDLNTVTKSSNTSSSQIELFTPRNGGDTPYNEQKRSVSIGSQSSKAETPPKSHESTPSLELEKDAARILEELSRQVDPCHPTKHELETPANNASPQVASSDASVTSSSTGLTLSLEHNDLEKVWHYQDPSGKVQGPFCMWQLRKWHLSGYFPSDLKIWKIHESRDSSVLLSEVLFLHGHGSDCQLQSNNSCFGSKDANITSDSRNFEHNVQLSSNMNIDSTIDEQNKGQDSDMTDGAACNVDEKQAVAEENNGKGEGLQCSLMSSKENQKSSQAESSLDKGEAVRQSLISSSTAGHLLMVDHSHEHEESYLPRLTVEDVNEDFKSSRMENDEFSASALCDKNPSSPSQDSSSARLELPNLQNLPSNFKDEDTKEAEAENKGKNDDTNTATEDKQPPQTSASPEQNPSTDWNDPPNLHKLEFADLPKQMQELHNKDMDSPTEDTKASTASDLPVQDSGMTSWNPISAEIELSIPVSSAVLENKDMKGDTPMGHCVSLGQDVGVSWSASSSMVVCGPVPVSSEWVGYSHMHTKPCEDLDTGLVSGPSIKFGEPSNGHETASGWHDGLIELSTLGDESVSDLLSEVEALESMNGGMASTSRIDCGDDTIDSPSNDCFDTLVGLSPTLDHGKSDGWSSTCTVQFCSQPTPTGEESHSPPRVFELNIDGCSTRTSNAGTSSPCTEGQREMKPGFDSSHSQDSALVHAPPETLHSVNLVSYTSDLKPEGSAKLSPTHLENLASEGLLTASLPLPTSLGLTSSPVSEGDMKLVDVSVNLHDFLPQDQAPPSISFGKSVDISNPEQKAGVDPSYIPVSTKEVVAQADLLPSSRPPSPIISRLNTSSPIGEEVKGTEVSQGEVSSPSPSLPHLPPPLPAVPAQRPSSSSTSRMNLPGLKEEGEMKQTDAFVDSGEFAPQAHELPLSPPQSALSPQLPTSPSTSSMGSPAPTEEGQMKQSDASVNHEELAPDVQKLSLPLPLSALPVQLPTSTFSSGMDSPGPKEEGEMKQHDASVNHEELAPEVHELSPPLPPSALPVQLPTSPSSSRMDSPGPKEEGEMKQSGGQKQPGASALHKELAPQVDELPPTLSVLPIQLPTSPSTSRMDSPGPKEDREKKQPDACVKHDEFALEVHEPSPPPSLSGLPALLPASPSTSRMYLTGLGGKNQPDASVNLEEVVLPGQELSPPPLSTSRMDSPVSPPSPPSTSKMDSPVSPPSPPATRADAPEEGELEATISSSYVEQPGQDHCPPESLLPPPPPLPPSHIKTSIPEEKINPPSHSANKQKNNGHKQKNNGSTSQAGRPQPSHKMSSLDSSVKSATVRVNSNFSPPGSSARNNKSTSWVAGRGNSRITSSGHSNPHRDPAVFYVTANHQGNNREMQQQTRYQGVLGRPSCPKDWNYHPYPHQHPGMVQGFIKPNRQSWNRQCIPYGGSVGGGLPHQPLPGHSRQRVCKFYESGYCKKGASCTFLHPS